MHPQTTLTWLPRLLCILCIPLMAKDILHNGTFEQLNGAGTFPIHWAAGTYSGAQGTITLEQNMVASGKASVRLQQTSKKGWMGCNQTVRLPQPTKAPCEVHVSVRIAAEALGRGSLVLTAGPAKNVQRQWVSLAQWQGSFEWKTFSKKLILEPGTERVVLSIRTSAPGMMWCDDASLDLKQPLPSKGQELLLNGNLSGPTLQKTGLPKHWKTKFYEGLEAVGTVTLNQTDSKVPMLTMNWLRGARKFGAEADVRDIPTGRHDYELSAQIRTSADGMGALAVDILDGRGTVIDQLYSPTLCSQTWKPLTYRFSTPDQAVALRVHCLSMEKGQVCFRKASCRWLGKSSAAQKLPLEATILPVSWNRLWNGGKNEFTTFREAPVPLAFAFKGIKAQLKSPELQLELPAELTVADAFCTHSSMNHRETWTTEPVTRVEGRYLRYRFKNLKAFQILCPDYAWERKVAILIVPSQQDAAPKSTYRTFWRLADQNRSTPEENFTLRLEPMPPKARLPKSFRIIRWGQNDYLFTQPELLRKSWELLERCGASIGELSAAKQKGGKQAIAEQRHRGWSFMTGHADFYHLRFLSDELKKTIGQRMEYQVNLHGLDKRKICPQFLTDDPQCRNLFKDMIKKFLEQENPQPGDIYSLDTEPWAPMEWCLCERCRKAFAQSQNLDHVPDATEIRQNFPRQWSQFRCGQMAKVIELCGEVTKKHFPKVIFADYDYIVDFRKPNYKDSYQHVAKDPELNEQYLDLHLTSYYHTFDKDAFDMLRVNTRKLQKPSMPIAAIDGIGFLTAAEVLNPKQIFQMIIAAAVHACPGFGIYSGRHVDGQMLLACRKALMDIACLEDYLALGKTDAQDVTVTPRPFRTQKIKVGKGFRTLSFPNWRNHLAVSAIPRGQERLITIFNYHPQRDMFADCIADLPAGQYTLCNPTTGKAYPTPLGQRSWNAQDLNQGILLKIPPQDVTFLLIRPRQNTDDTMPLAEKAAETERQFRLQQARQKQGTEVQNQKVGNQSIQLSDVNEDGSPELELTSGDLRIWVDYAKGGDISKLSFHGQTFPATWASDQIWMPKEYRGQAGNKATVREATIKDGVIRCVLEKNASQLPLTIRKTLTLKSDQPRIHLSYRLVNHSNKPLTFSWWVKNLISQTLPPKLWNQRAGNLQPVPLAIGDTVYHVAPQTSWGFPPHKADNCLSGSTSKATWKHISMTVRQKNEDLMSLYYWCGADLKTWEWMYKPLTLQPGQSHTYELSMDLNWTN